MAKMNLYSLKDNNNRKNKMFVEARLSSPEGHDQTFVRKGKDQKRKRYLEPRYIPLSYLEEDVFFEIHNIRVVDP